MADIDAGLTPDVRSRLREIRSLEQRQGAAAAETALIRLLKEEPDTPEVLTTIARFMSRQKRFREAAKAVERALTLAPLDANIAVLAGFVQLRLEDRARAAEYFAEAIRLNQESAPAHLGLAAVQMMDEDYETALRFCDRAIDLDPTLQRAYELVARINVRQGRKDLAIAELKSILDENPDAHRVATAYVQLLQSEGRSSEAMAFLEDEVAREPENRKTISQLARLAVRQGQPGVAVRHYRRLVESDSSRRTDMFRYISALIENGEIDEARSKIETLAAKPATKPIALVLLGDIARSQGNFESAIAHYNEAAPGGTSADAPLPGISSASSAEERARALRKHVVGELRSSFKGRAERNRSVRKAAFGLRAAPGGPQRQASRVSTE